MGNDTPCTYRNIVANSNMFNQTATRPYVHIISYFRCITINCANCHKLRQIAIISYHSSWIYNHWPTMTYI